MKMALRGPNSIHYDPRGRPILGESCAVTDGLGRHQQPGGGRAGFVPEYGELVVACYLPDRDARILRAMNGNQS